MPTSPASLRAAAPRAQTYETQLMHNAGLDIYDEIPPIRMNGIICTIGPKTQEVAALKQLIKAGMNVVRMNFSHGSHEYHAATVKNARQAAQESNATVAIALDTKGPEIRTGKMKDGKEITYQSGATVRLSTDKKNYDQGDENLIFVDYANITKVAGKGGNVFIDDGLLSLEVVQVGTDYLDCQVKNTATLSDHKGVNLPNMDVDLPAVSEKDASDLRFGVEQGVDMVFASFIRKASDVRDVRAAMGPGGEKILIISKIENHEGCRNFREIVEVSDGIMVARGDLGIEIPPEKVFVAQKMMIANCNVAGKPVICATQMLESMTFNPRPTRAEISDVANAVLDGADCVMLSGETAKGKYPVETVTMMDRLCREAQNAMLEWQHFQQVKNAQPIPLSIQEVICQSAVNTAYELKAPLIVVLTNTGDTARAVAKYRPRCPVYGVTSNAQTARQLVITRSCFPMLVQEPADKKDYDARLVPALARAKEQGLVRSGDSVVTVHADATFKGGANLVRVVRVP